MVSRSRVQPSLLGEESRTRGSGGNRAYSLTDIEERYNFEIPFTTYYGLLKAIPTEWKSELRTATNAHVTATHLKLLSTKTVYPTLLDKSFLVPTAETRSLNYGFAKDNIRNIYMLPFRILKETKLIMFQV